MKARAFLAATAITFSSMTPAISPAGAAVTILDPTPDASGPTAATMAAMQAQCDAKATAHGPAWSGEVDESSIVPTYVSGPTEVGTHSIADATGPVVPGAGATYHPDAVTISGDPYRIGGSVNMFGLQVSPGGTYSTSAYDYEADFETKYSYAFNCTMTEEVDIPVQGYYVVADNAPGNSGDAIKANCDAFTEMGNDPVRPPWWGLPEDHAFCHFIKTADASTGEEERDDEAGTPEEETQTDTLAAHEDAGEAYHDDTPTTLGQVVVCISPTTSTQTKKGAPGTWTPKNGYNGSKCTTIWYNGGATLNVPNLNDGSHNFVTVPVV